MNDRFGREIISVQLRFLRDPGPRASTFQRAALRSIILEAPGVCSANACRLTHPCLRRRIMLKGIPSIISPELMSVLLSMGHGDELVIADGNFPATSMARR